MTAAPTTRIDNLPLVLDLIAWVAERPRTYAETMDAWRTSCPRLTIWEDAIEHGFVARTHTMVTATTIGETILRTHRP